jgi:hypothetical protein
LKPIKISNVPSIKTGLNVYTENYSVMFGYINTGRVNIRIHRDVTGEMWFGVG